ncbi:hypothetical protein KTC96_24865 (plasmid) [Clostridium estertheticum]|uniref:hypothetical protein n=1 Tax=Clostridium estertheticum TaxID=238834 RepID=UPI001C7D8E23|nr:hypothetical protein [Clostridium estertheticum]MBX4259761.1 hypothetical protein [Clostridium estertheticum]WLC73255.1 hypothetical protein KTC96_24865 [Clostridium estertheticum]
MVVVEVIPFGNHKERIKVVKSLGDRNKFSVHDNYICVYKENKATTWESYYIY